MGLGGMAWSASAAAAGTIMYGAVTYQVHGFRLSTVGLILMIAGAAGFVVSTIVSAVTRREVGTTRHSMSRGTTNSEGVRLQFTKSVSNGLGYFRNHVANGSGSLSTMTQGPRCRFHGFLSTIRTKKGGAIWVERVRS
jgi:hypothetical protein